MRSLLALPLSIVLMSTGCVYSYPFPNATLPAPKVCGQKKRCDADTTGKSFHFTKQMFAPEIGDETGAKDIAMQVVGRTVDPSDLWGKRPLICSDTDESPFPQEHIVATAFKPPGYDVKYQRKAKVELDVAAEVAGQMKAIEVQGADMKAALEAKLTAAYSMLNDKELTLQGQFTTWTLSSKATDPLVKQIKYQKCFNYLQAQNRRLIVSAAIVSYEVLYQEKSLSDLRTTLDSELEAAGVDRSLSAKVAISFQKKVEEALTAKYQMYQVISWTTATIQNGDLAL